MDAMRKMTFTLPEDLAARFIRRVAAGERSRYIATAIAAKLARTEKRLLRACGTVNSDPGVKEIEAEFDALDDEIVEPWCDGQPSAP
jgi:metal-responsive CopG/Arc/MetJ family transcriptional regulator